MFNVRTYLFIFLTYCIVCIGHSDKSYWYPSQNDDIVITLEQGQSISNLASYSQELNNMK